MNSSTTRSLVALSLALMWTLAGCGGKLSQAKPEVKAAARNPLEITAGPDLVQQIKIGAVPWAAVNGTLQVAGLVEANETRMARISAPVTGHVMTLNVIEGEPVRRGQVLATIHSTELTAAQSALLKALSQQQLAERAVSRARQLLDAGVIGAAELQRREAELQQANAELSASRDQLTVLGMTPEDLAQLETSRTVHSVTHVVSSIDGQVLERKVTIGQVIQAAETIFVVADLSNVWLVADVPEQSAGSLGLGKAVRAEIPALPGPQITGTLSFVSSIVNPQTRTVRARMDLANPELLYKPAMLATMTLLDGAERRHVAPSEALVREDNQDHVFVQTGPATFVLRPVKLGLESANTRVLESGVTTAKRLSWPVLFI